MILRLSKDDDSFPKRSRSMPLWITFWTNCSLVLMSRLSGLAVDACVWSETSMRLIYSMPQKRTRFLSDSCSSNSAIIFLRGGVRSELFLSRGFRLLWKTCVAYNAVLKQVPSIFGGKTSTTPNLRTALKNHNYCCITLFFWKYTKLYCMAPRTQGPRVCLALPPSRPSKYS